MSSIPEPGLAPGLPGTSRAARYGLGSLAAIALLFLGLPVAALLARGLFGGALRDASAEALFDALAISLVASFATLAVVVMFGSPLAWVYLVTVFATALFAIAALIEAVRQSRALAVGERTGATTFVFALIFILLVGFLGIYGLTAVPGMRGLNAGIFPEVLTPFSLRAFGAFYLSLALAVIPLLWLRGRGNVLTHGFAAYGLIVFITAAAFINGRRLVGAHPVEVFQEAVRAALEEAKKP